MKKLFIVLAIAASFQLASAQNQVKSVAAAKSAYDKASAAAENPKQNKKVATWLKYAQSLLDVYAAPAGNAWLGMTQQELTILGGNEKPMAEEQVMVNGQPMLKYIYANRNLYFNQNLQLSIVEVTNPIVEDALAKAVKAYQTAYEIDPSKSSDIVKGLQTINDKYVADAYTAYTMGDYTKASAEFEKAFDAVAMAPCSQIDSNSLYNAAFTAFAAGADQRAEELFKKCLEISYYGDDGDVYAKLATLAEKAGNKELSKEYLEQGFLNHPQSQGILVGLINYYISSGEDTDRLFQLIDGAKANEPNNASLYYVEGNAREKLGDHEGAIKAYTQCSEINPDYEFGYVGLGILYYNQAVDLQEKASNELDDAKYMALQADFEKALKSCIEPFEKAYEISTNEETKAAIAEYLKNACFRFRTESQEYMDKYNKYSGATAQ